MLCINTINHNVYFHLAAEEYLLRNFKQDILMLWISSPSIVLGKHQNAHGELNFRYAHEEGIHIARRLSGGGTVYHDEQNLNFTFITNGEDGKLVDFKKYIDPIIDFLDLELEIPVYRSDRNDIILKEKKISGNAEHVFKNRTLHHGTLLVNSDLEKLRKALNVNKEKYTTRAVPSVTSKVTSLQEFSGNRYNIEYLKDDLFQYLKKKFSGRDYFLKYKDIDAITQLEIDKYRTWDWIYGYSPKYTLDASTSDYQLQLHVEKGIVTKVSTDQSNLTAYLEESILNEKLELDHVQKRMNSASLKQILPNVSYEKFIFDLF